MTYQLCQFQKPGESFDVTAVDHESRVAGGGGGSSCNDNWVGHPVKGKGRVKWEFFDIKVL